jgi:hypothetical protein
LSEVVDFVVNFLLETGEVVTGENNTSSSTSNASPIDLEMWAEVTKDIERIGKGNAEKGKEQEDGRNEKPITFVALREEDGEGGKGKEEELDAMDGVDPPNGLSLISLANGNLFLPFYLFPPFVTSDIWVSTLLFRSPASSVPLSRY